METKLCRSATGTKACIIDGGRRSTTEEAQCGYASKNVEARAARLEQETPLARHIGGGRKNAAGEERSGSVSKNVSHWEIETER
ncbi:hypothetical protein SESBI_31687 [Sesbania bispinosa]|nr:hypothetical protein SESBI_31687 [Sesbania bispinosa]